MGRAGPVLEPPVLIARASVLDSPADAVWAHAITPEGINAELMPLVRMTFPKHLDLTALGPDDLGRPLAACWLLAFGVVPLDRHVLVLDHIGARSFVERSHSLMQREWRHERWVEDRDGRALLCDRVSVIPRLRPAAPLVRAIVSRIFANRHAWLRRHFGGDAADHQTCAAVARGSTLPAGETDSPPPAEPRQ